MLCRLAWGNVCRAGRDYLVYLITLTLAVSVYYAFNTISFQINYANISEKGLADLLGGVIGGLTVFLAVVMGFLLVYANNFIMKRRKKEFGLYQLLGMGRLRVAGVMAIETLVVSCLALVLGIVLGVCLSQLMVFFTASLFKTQIADFHFFFSTQALSITVACLVATFIVTLICNLWVVARAKVIDLVSASRKGERIRMRNPWLAAIVCVIGLAAIGVSYYRLLRDGLPVDGVTEHLQAFLITTLLVVVGTCAFFFGFSGLLLKLLQRVRALYWSGLNMFTLRQLSAKVNTVSFSMAIISLILFLAITSVTGGMSIVDAMNSTIERGTPADASVSVYYYGEVGAEQTSEYARGAGDTESIFKAPSNPVDLFTHWSTYLQSAQEAQATSDTKDKIDAATLMASHTQVDLYDSAPKGSQTPLVTLTDLSKLTGISLPQGVISSDANSSGLSVMSESQYNEYLAFRGLEPIELGDHGYLITCDMGGGIIDIYNAALTEGIPLNAAGIELTPAAQKVNEDASTFGNSSTVTNAGTLVVPDVVIQALQLPVQASILLADYPAETDVKAADEIWSSALPATRRVVDGDGAIIGYWTSNITRADIYAGANSLNGLVSYLAIYIGFVLIVACAAILAIQQLSSVSDSAKSCRVLSELGCERREVVRSTLIQQLVFFGFPLVLAIVHSIIALRVVVDIAQLFGGISIDGAVGPIIVIFLLAYGGYFFVTHLLSSAIVTDAMNHKA